MYVFVYNESPYEMPFVLWLCSIIRMLRIISQKPFKGVFIYNCSFLSTAGTNRFTQFSKPVHLKGVCED